jgi:hypothetical protein
MRLKHNAGESGEFFAKAKNSAVPMALPRVCFYQSKPARFHRRKAGRIT